MVRVPVAATRLGCSAADLYRWIDDGAVPAWRLDGRVVVDLSQARHALSRDRPGAP